MTRGHLEAARGWKPPTLSGGCILFPQLLPTGLHIEIRCAYAAAGYPGRIYAQAMSAWALLHPAVPLSPFCRKCNIHRPHWNLKFQPRLRYALGTWRQPLGSVFSAASNFGSSHLTRASWTQSCLDSLPLSVLSGSTSMWAMPSSAQPSAASWHSAAGKAKARSSTPLSTPLTRDFGGIILSGRIVL